MNLSKRLERIEKLISTDLEYNFIYAALECRLALEDITREKLKLYEKRYNKKILNKHWQPDKAVKQLLQFEPDVDQSYELLIKIEDSELAPKSIGRHESITQRSISKLYQSLGSFLHIQNKETDFEKLKIKVKITYNEIKRINTGSLTSNIAKLGEFKCEECETIISFNLDALNNIYSLYCPKDSCGARYRKSSDSSYFKLENIKFTCPECRIIMLLSPIGIDLDDTFKCKSCNTEFLVNKKQLSVIKYNK